MEKMNIKALAMGLGASWGLYMLVLGWTAAYGFGIGFVETMSSMYIGFAPTFVGGIIGGIWGFIDGAVGGAIIAYVYNMVCRK